MSDSPTDRDTPANSAQIGPNDRVVYVMPENVVTGQADDEIDLGALVKTLWDAKLTILAITAAFTLASVAYAFLATEWYRAEVLLAPVEEMTAPGIAGQLGGLASLAGVTLGEKGSTAEAVATLQSRELAREFIEQNDLIPVLFADDWDAAQKAWRPKDPEDWPDVRDAIEMFHEDILQVSQNRQTSLVTLGVTWTDADAAAKWANELARRVNQRMRSRALREAEANVAYLQSELASANVVTLQQSIGSLLETEMQKLMLARGNEEFAFRVVDAAQPAKRPDQPKRPIVIALGVVLGGLMGIFWAFARGALSRTR